MLIKIDLPFSPSKMLELEVKPTDTKYCIVQKVAEMTAIAPGKQWIIFNGRRMNDDQTMQDLGITEGSELYVYLLQPLDYLYRPLQKQTTAEFNSYAGQVLRSLYETRETSGDISIVSASKAKFRVHRFLLAQHSPVFQAMLGMEEGQENLIKMYECRDTVVENLISFLYTGSDNSWTDTMLETNTYQMLEMAHVYQVQKLIDFCWDHVQKTLTGYTVFKWLVLADRLNADEPKRKIGKFFMQEHESLKTTYCCYYHDFIKKNTKLYLEICRM